MARYFGALAACVAGALIPAMANGRDFSWGAEQLAGPPHPYSGRSIQTSDGHVHLFYSRRDTTLRSCDLRHVEWSAGTLSNAPIETLPCTQDVQFLTPLETSTGELVVIYRVENADLADRYEFRHANLGGGSDPAQSIRRSPRSMICRETGPCLLETSDGAIHLFYDVLGIPDGAAILEHARYTGTDWTVAEIDSVEGDPPNFAILQMAFESDDEGLHAVYELRSGVSTDAVTALWHARYNPDDLTWSFLEELDEIPAGGSEGSYGFENGPFTSPSGFTSAVYERSTGSSQAADDFDLYSLQENGTSLVPQLLVEGTVPFDEEFQLRPFVSADGHTHMFRLTHDWVSATRLIHHIELQRGAAPVVRLAEGAGTDNYNAVGTVELMGRLHFTTAGSQGAILGQVRHHAFDGDEWLATPITTFAGVARVERLLVADDVLHVFSSGQAVAGGTYFERLSVWDGEDWSTTTVAGPFTSRPNVGPPLHTSTGAIELLLGQAANVVHATFDGEWTFTGITFAPHPINAAPALSETSDGNLHVFARGTANGVVHSQYDGTAWGATETLYDTGATHNPGGVTSFMGGDQFYLLFEWDDLQFKRHLAHAFTCDCADDGLVCTGEACGAIGGCIHPPVAAGLACGDAETECAFAETCDGAGACQANPKPIDTPCGDDAETDCDAADTCDGTGACQDNFVASGTACGDPGEAACDHADSCTGDGICAANLAPAGTSCGDPETADCDQPDECDADGACQPRIALDGNPCTSDGAFCSGAEVCDDGGCTSAGDPCNAETETCAEDLDACIPQCGDGMRDEADEACDDGNNEALDGCSATCTVEDGWGCTGGVGGQSACESVCGDGVPAAGGEACEDENTEDGDGCSAACTIEDGWECAADEETGLSMCTTLCGDGLVRGEEGCDDGGDEPGDGCSADCAVEAGFACDTEEPSTCGPLETCGDGVLDPGEECDDGETASDDGCSAGCDVEPGWLCDAAEPSVCVPDDDGDGDEGDGDEGDEGDGDEGDGDEGDADDQLPDIDAAGDGHDSSGGGADEHDAAGDGNPVGDEGCGCGQVDAGGPAPGLLAAVLMVMALRVRDRGVRRDRPATLRGARCTCRSRPRIGAVDPGHAAGEQRRRLRQLRGGVLRRRLVARGP